MITWADIGIVDGGEDLELGEMHLPGAKWAWQAGDGAAAPEPCRTGQQHDSVLWLEKSNREHGVTQGMGDEMDPVTALAWIPISSIHFQLRLFTQNLQAVLG